MINIIYYILEALKFVCIYVVGFKMSVTESVTKKILMVATTIVTGVAMNYLRETDYFPILYLVFVFTFVWLFIVEHTWKNIILTFWSMAIVFSIDTIGYVLLKIGSNVLQFSVGAWEDVVGSLLTIIILYILFWGISRKSQFSLKKISFWYYIVFLLVCVVNAFVMVVIEMYYSLENTGHALVYLFLVISSLSQMGFVLMLAASNSWHRKNEELKERYLELQKEHYQYLDEKNIETKKFRHDMRAHLFIIQQYMKEEKWQELDKYIVAIYGKLEHIPGYLSVQNGIVDAILNYYGMQFRKIECEFRVKGNMPNECRVHAFDLCTIFSNICSNALEAVEKAEDKVVELVIRHEGNQIFIRETNSYVNDIKKNGNKLLTNKRDKEYHGFGIDNIREAVKKYCGDMNLQMENDKFILEIILENDSVAKGND